MLRAGRMPSIIRERYHEWPRGASDLVYDSSQRTSPARSGAWGLLAKTAYSS